MQPVVVSHTLLHDVAMGGNAAVVARGTGAEEAGPINTHSFRYRWDWRGSRYRVADDEPRHDLFHAPVGTVVVFSDLLNVGYAIPFWPEDQVESVKRGFCECLRHSFGRAPRTTSFHIEAPVSLCAGHADSVGGVGWARVWACDQWPVRSRHGLKVVFDETPVMWETEWPWGPWPHASGARFLFGPTAAFSNLPDVTLSLALPAAGGPPP